MSPIRDADGRVVGASKIARDISDRKQAELRDARRDAFLAEVTLTLTRSLDYEQTLKALASLTVPYRRLLRRRRRQRRGTTRARVAVTHREPAKARIAQELRGARYDGSGIFGQSAPGAEDRSVSFIPRVTDDMIVAAATGRSRTAGENPVARSRLVHVRADGCARSDAGRADAGERRIAHPLSPKTICGSLRTWRRAPRWPSRTRSRTEQLQNANRLKDEFLATLSHELRTPLNAVLGYARMLQSGAIHREKAAQALEVIDRNAGALAQIVEDVLDVSRIVLGQDAARSAADRHCDASCKTRSPR